MTAGLPIRPAPAAFRISTVSPILLHPSLFTVFRVVPTLNTLCHGMDIGTCDIVHWSAAPHNHIANRTGFWVNVLVLNVIRYSCHYFVDRILFHHDFYHDSCDYHWDFYGHWLPFDLFFRLPLHVILVLQMHNSLNVSAAGHSTGEFHDLQLIVLAAFGAVD